MNLIGASVDLVKKQASAVSTTIASAKPYLPQVSAGSLAAGLGVAKKHAVAMVSTRDGAVGTAAAAVGVAVGAYFLWPVAAAGTVAAAGMMKAPGAAGIFISRAAFLANPQLYFQLLHTVGAKGAAAAFGGAKGGATAFGAAKGAAAAFGAAAAAFGAAKGAAAAGAAVV